MPLPANISFPMDSTILPATNDVAKLPRSSGARTQESEAQVTPRLLGHVPTRRCGLDVCKEMLEYGTYYASSNVLWLERVGSQVWEQVCAIPEGLSLFYTSRRDFSRVEWRHQGAVEKCTNHNKTGPSEIYIQQLTQGWCLVDSPHGTTSGDLCAPPISADLPGTCDDVDENFYDRGDEHGAKAKCSADTACKGYTKNIDTGRIKLKGSVAISGVRPDNNYQCHQKILLV
jgi:hypothetical protein